MQLPSEKRWRFVLISFCSLVLASTSFAQGEGYDSFFPPKKAPSFKDLRQRFISKRDYSSAFDTLLVEIHELNQPGIRDSEITIDPRLRAKIRVVRGKDDVSETLLLHKGPPSWPEVLKTEDYQKERERVEQLLREAVQRLNKGEETIALGKEIEELIPKMIDRLEEHLSEYTFVQQIEARRYLRDFIRSTARTLQKKDVRDYLRAAKEIPEKCRTVSDLVEYLIENRFRIGYLASTKLEDYRELTRVMETYIEQAKEKAAKKK